MQALSIKPQGNKAQKKKITESAEIFHPHHEQKPTENVTDAIREETAKTAKKFWQELLGIQQTTQEMHPGVSYDLKEPSTSEHAANRAPIDYAGEILRTGTGQQEKKESEQRITQLVAELRNLAESVKMVEKAVVMQALGPSVKGKSGKYYESFFEWMLAFVHDARRKVEDSAAWLQSTSGKKNKRAGIHKLMKTNMRVGLSEERSKATQTG